MKQHLADRLVGVLAVAILLSGVFVTWQTYLQWSTASGMGGHMDGSMIAMHGTHPLWYLFGTLSTAGIIVGLYLLVRDQFTIPATTSSDSTKNEGASKNTQEDSSRSEETTDSAPDASQRVLDLLPDDERRILKPVLESPGVTQIELRDRSEFSKSKVSQTVSDLEKRGLLYRESQGRTFRVYPSDELEQGETPNER